MKKNFILIIVLMFFPMMVSGQAAKPTIMVLPDDAWCNANGYVQEFEIQGKVTKVSDYERAVQENMELLNAVTKIGALMADRGMPLKDLASTLKSINQSNIENEMRVSRTSGSTIAETPLDRLRNRSQADILVYLSWKVNTIGPKNSVTYTLKGVDAYTDEQVAASQGTGASSFSAEIPVLIEEAVMEHMDNFIAQLQGHFDDLLANGRKISLGVHVFDNGTGQSLEDEFDGVELTGVIEDWVAQNSVSHRYNLSVTTENMMRFDVVRISLYRENGMPMNARHFANELRKYLRKPPYNLTVKLDSRGLGNAELIIGEK